MTVGKIGDGFGGALRLLYVYGARLGLVYPSQWSVGRAFGRQAVRG